MISIIILSTSNLLNHFITTYLMLCHFAVLLLAFLARWRERSFAALLDPPRQALGLRMAYGVPLP